MTDHETEAAVAKIDKCLSDLRDRFYAKMQNLRTDALRVSERKAVNDALQSCAEEVEALRRKLRGEAT